MKRHYPLEWPAGWPRSEFRDRSRFNAGSKYVGAGANTTKAIHRLTRELELLGATGCILTSNVQITVDGRPYQRRRPPEDTGVAVYFDLDGEKRCIPCDRWDRVGCNIWAIVLSIEALRGLDRWGARKMVDMAFRGFKALPAGPQWFQVLGVSPDERDRKRIKRAFLQNKAHPDQGGTDTARFQQVSEAYRTGLALAEKNP